MGLMSFLFTSLCRANDIGANCYAFDFHSTKVVVDCGMHPKREGLDSIGRLDVLAEEKVDAFFLSHSHLDHTGGMPVFLRQHPEADVYMTQQTAALADGLLHNSVNVMTKKREELGITDYPLFSHDEVEEQAERWQHKGLRKAFSIGEQDVVSTTFYDAGHILGAVGIRFDCESGSVLYTGDVNFEGQTIMRPADFPRGHIDTLILETTRGASARTEGYTRQKEKQRLGEHIQACFDRGGAVMIPVFAIGKTQELLVMLAELEEEGVIENAPIFIGGLSTKMTNIYDELAGHSRRNYPDLSILEDLEIQVASRRRRKQVIQVNPRCIYALSSGMMTEKTVSNGVAQRFLHDEKNALLFVGYADPESPAGKILAAEKGDLIELDENLPPVALNCEVESFDFSGHATREQLRDYAVELSPSKVFLVHGEMDAMNWFQQEFQVSLPNTEVIIPEPEKQYSLFAENKD